MAVVNQKYPFVLEKENCQIPEQICCVFCLFSLILFCMDLYLFAQKKIQGNLARAGIL